MLKKLRTLTISQFWKISTVEKLRKLTKTPNCQMLFSIVKVAIFGNFTSVKLISRKISRKIILPFQNQNAKVKMILIEDQSAMKLISRKI